MFACCCRDTTSPRSEEALEIEPEAAQGVQAASRKSAGAASAAAGAADERARAAEARAAAADGPDSNAVAAVEAAAAAAASGVAAAVAADATAADARRDAKSTQETGPAKSVVISTTKKETAPVKKPLTAPTTQRARRTSVPLESPIEEGVFLMYDASTATIYALWSQTPQPAALAWLKPLVAIPGHKFKVNGGKQVFFNNAQLLQLVEAPGAKDESSCVAEAITEYNKLYDLKNVKAVAVVPLSSTLIETGKNLSPQRFLQMGTGEGHAAPIQIKRV
ncbi:hypothetical protein Emed_006696 [Eimeria media]